MAPMVTSVIVRASLRLGQALVPVAAIAFGLGTVLAIPRAELTITTYAGVSRATEAADLAAGLGLLVAGMLIWIDRPASGRGLLAVLAGVAWFAPDVAGWEAGPPLARSVAMLVEPLFLPLVLHLVLVGPGGRLGSSSVRLAVAASYAVAAVVSVGQALFRDPFLDPYCWNNCRDNLFLISAEPAVARWLREAWSVASIAMGAGLALVAVWQLVSSTRAGRRARLPLLLPGFLLGSEATTHASILLVRPQEWTADPLLLSLFLSRATSTFLLSLGLVWLQVRARGARIAVARLATDLGAAPPPGTVGLALARATGDPDVEVVYPLAPGDRWVDSSGRTVELPASGEGRAVTPIVAGDRRVALVIHDAAAVDAAQLRQEIGAAARLAIDNERLQAEVRAQLADLRASRMRIVETGDAERRRLERNLHDGAQQGLLAAAYDLRVALAAAAVRAAEPVAEVLASAVEETEKAINDLRDLAHGIYPAILTEAGIGAALSTLADSAPVAVDLSETPAERFSQAVERTAFMVASEGIDTAGTLGSASVGVRVFRESNCLVVEVTGAGPRPSVHLADRVGALGGRLHTDAAGLRAEIPCV
jgi:signal transduction histidine kinase